MNTNNRPEITRELIDEIQYLIQTNPSKGRTWLSLELCRKWGWQGQNGQLKDISCRDLLRALESAGKIDLPAPQKISQKPRKANKILHIVHDETHITVPLRELRPLQVSIAETSRELTVFKSFIDQYHYLGFNRFIGERIAYIIESYDGRLLAALLFGSAAWSCKDRDGYIGWDKNLRKSALNYITNNSRFLIAPWVSVPHLASHALSLIGKRISTDWQHKYGHPVYMLETFVENGRFVGTCYKAANWVRVGATTGRGRDGGHKHAIMPTKDIYLMPLTKKWREMLLAGQSKEATWGSTSS
jgi:hypothetical protein